MATLLSALPDNVREKLREEELTTVEGCGKAISNSVSLHSGEVAELDPQRTTWCLRQKAPGSASADWGNP